MSEKFESGDTFPEAALTGLSNGGGQRPPASGGTSGPPCSASRCPACGLGEHGKDALCDHHYGEYLGQHKGSHSDVPDDGQTFYTPNAGTEARRVAVASGALLADGSKGGEQ